MSARSRSAAVKGGKAMPGRGRLVAVPLLVAPLKARGHSVSRGYSEETPVTRSNWKERAVRCILGVRWLLA